ncbi:MAG: hypothetical protein CUN52_04120 [Phototrophicales bacterium]|nr:MAG: hypothetical protein CUN52_04120 [Phototrophicales bacterium]
MDYQRYSLLQEQFVTRYQKDLVRNIVLRLDTGFAAGGDDQAFDSITGIPHIRPLNLTSDEALTIEDTKYVPTDRPKTTDYIQKGEVLFNNTNSSIWVGKSVVFTEDYRACCSNHITRLTIDLEKAVPQYIADVFNLLRRKRLFEFYCVNFNNQAGINTEMLGELPIPLPPLNIQRALVADLDHARTTRKAKLAEANALLTEMDAVVMRELGITVSSYEPTLAFGVRLGDALKRLDVHYHQPQYTQYSRRLDALTIPKLKISQLSPQIIGGATPERDNHNLYTTEGIKLLRIMNVAPYEIDLTDVKYITEDVHNRLLARSQLRVGDILMTITGRVGTCAVVTEDVLPANINQHLVILRIDTRLCLTDYFVAYMNSEMGRALSNRPTTGGTRIALDYQAIGNLEIPIPPLDIQQQLITELHTRRERARQLRQEADKIWQEAQARFEQALIG